jgi:hypothetical protein
MVRERKCGGKVEVGIKVVAGARELKNLLRRWRRRASERRGWRATEKLYH